MSVPVFISYHGPDLLIATSLKEALEAVSDGQFEVFIDKYSIEAGEEWAHRISEEIARAEWFLILCTGSPRRDAHMMWSFFEAGRFCATLPSQLAPHASSRMVCLFDREPPSILSNFQGIHVEDRQRSGAKVDMAMMDRRANIQLDDTFVFNLLKQMLDNKPNRPLRDTSQSSVKKDLREQSHKLIDVFMANGGGDVIKDQALQPRLSYELGLGGGLRDSTRINGFDGSLDRLFSIATPDTTWGKILEVCCGANGPKPIWMSDVEASSRVIADERNPDVSATKCILNGTIYRVFTARYETYKSGKRMVYIGFLPAVGKTFDLKRASGTLLSALILSIRFREQLIPHRGRIAETQDPGQVLEDFYRKLLAMEIEARQFGLASDTDDPEEAALPSVIRREEARGVIVRGIAEWLGHRAKIDTMFARDASGRNPRADIASIANMMDDMAPVNARFIEAIVEELLDQSRRENQHGAILPA